MEVQRLDSLLKDLSVNTSKLQQLWFWDFNGSYADRNAMLLRSGFRSDVTLIIGSNKEKVEAHRFILQIASPVFDRVFHNNPKLDKLEIQSVESAEFLRFLKYIYTGESEIPIDEAETILNIASKFEVENLIRSCFDALTKEMNNSNVLKLFQSAMKLGNKELVEACLAFICKKAYKIIQTEEFSKLTLDCVFEIAQRDDLRIRSEGQLFEAIMRWGEAECQRENLDPLDVTARGETHLQDELKKLIPLVRFPLMDRDYFVEKVLTQQILTEREELALITILGTSVEKRASLYGIRGAKTFSAKARDYFKSAVQSVYRGYRELPGPRQIIDSQLTASKCEDLRVTVSRNVTLVGLKFSVDTFILTSFSDRGTIGWDLFNANITIRELKGTEKILFTEDVKSFNPYKHLNESQDEVELFFARGVEFDAKTKYSVKIRFSGSLICNESIWNENKYELVWSNLLPGRAPIMVNNEGDELEDPVVFSFSQNQVFVQTFKRLPIGLIFGLMFECY